MITSKTFHIGCLVLSSILSLAQAPQPNKLQGLMGRWTIQGMEERFIEICEMYEGGYFLVCNSETKRKAGGVSKGVSIIGQTRDSDILSYYHYGSSGASQVLKGRIDEEGTMFFEGEEMSNGKLVKTRVTMKKAGVNYDFKEEVSEDGTVWTVSASIVYLRLKE